MASGVALGYLDLRTGDLDWRQPVPELAQWFSRFSKRPSFRQTAPVS